MVNRSLLLICATALLLAIQQPAFGQTISGQVVKIADGDTLTIVNAERRQIRVRLAEIDAPESHQPFGARSKQSLSELCFGKVAEIKDNGRDRYGRTIGNIRCGGIDVNAEQVRRGMAWVYDRYVKDRSLYTLQMEARAAHRGLWNDPNPIPPWEWRRANKRKKDH